MALSATHLVSATGSGSEVATVDTASFTRPTAGDLLCIFAWADSFSTGIDLTISANTGGLTLGAPTFQTTQSNFDSQFQRAALWVVASSGSGAMTVTVDAGASTKTAWMGYGVFSVSGAGPQVKSGQVKGSSADNGGGDSETITSGTFDTAAISGNLTAFLVGRNNDATGTGTVPSSGGYSSLFDTGASTFEAVACATSTTFTGTSSVWADLGQSVSHSHSIIVEFEESGAVTTEQEGFRFRNDDGSETTATWRQAQDTDDTNALDTGFRLRALIDTTNDLASTQFRLDYKKSTEAVGLWRAIGVGLTSYGSTPSVVGWGSAALSTNDPSVDLSSGSWTPATDDVVVFFIASTTVLDLVVDGSLPSGWFGALGSGVDVNSDAHGYCAIWHKVTSGEAGGSTTFTATNALAAAETGNVVAVALRGVDPTTPVHVSQSAFDSANTGSPDNLSALSGANQPTVTGCLVVRGVCQDSTGSYTTPGGHTSVTSNNTNQINQVFTRDAATTAGSDVASVAITPDAGDEDCAITIAFLPVVTIDTPAITPVLSSNFANGDATTGQLTAPASGSFVAGVMVENVALANAVDITSGNYTEIEWALKAQTPAVTDDVFNFRVTANGTALTTYSVTPDLTIGSSGEDHSTTGFAAAAAAPFATVTHGATITGLLPVGAVPMAAVSHAVSLAGHLPAGVTPQAAVSHAVSLAGLLPAGVTPQATVLHSYPIAGHLPAGAVPFTPVTHDYPIVAHLPVGTVPMAPVAHDSPLSGHLPAGTVPFAPVAHNATPTALLAVGAAPFSLISHDVSLAGLLVVGVAPFAFNPGADFATSGLLIIGAFHLADISHDVSLLAHLPTAAAPFSTVLHSYPISGHLPAGITPQATVSHDATPVAHLPAGIDARVTAATHNATITAHLPAAVAPFATVTHDVSTTAHLPVGAVVYALISSQADISTGGFSVAGATATAGAVSKDSTPALLLPVGVVARTTVSHDAIPSAFLAAGVDLRAGSYRKDSTPAGLLSAAAFARALVSHDVSIAGRLDAGILADALGQHVVQLVGWLGAGIVPIGAVILHPTLGPIYTCDPHVVIRVDLVRITERLDALRQSGRVDPVRRTKGRNC